jgi:hypothetical protein
LPRSIQSRDTTAPDCIASSVRRSIVTCCHLHRCSVRPCRNVIPSAFNKSVWRLPYAVATRYMPTASKISPNSRLPSAPIGCRLPISEANRRQCRDTVLVPESSAAGRTHAHRRHIRMGAGGGRLMGKREMCQSQIGFGCSLLTPQHVWDGEDQ